MKPGRELDAMVAEKVMGIDLTKPEEVPGSIFPSDYWTHFHKALGSPRIAAKPYSTDIAAAWEVAEKIKDKVFNLLYHPDGELWSLELGDRNTIGETASHAICLAALRDVGVEA